MKRVSNLHCGQPTDFITPRIWFDFLPIQKKVFRLSDVQLQKTCGYWPQQISPFGPQSALSAHASFAYRKICSSGLRFTGALVCLLKESKADLKVGVLLLSGVTLIIG